MAELEWPDDLGHGTLIGRFGFMDADGHDPDRQPDITSATGGKVIVTPSIRSVRYTGEGGPMILAARRAEGAIDAEGWLCTMAADGTAGDRGMVFPATDDTDLTPTDWTYEVQVKLDGGVTLPTFSIKLPTDATVDLSLAVPVSSSGGTAVVVDPSTAERAEAAASRAESAAADAEAWTPVFEWDGTRLVINGGTGPDLVGPPVEAVTETAPLAAGASAGTVTVSLFGPSVSADLAGVVLTGSSELVATIPTGYRPPHKAGHGFVEASNGDWWPVRATVTGIEVMGPAPAGTIVEGALSWSI